MCPWAPRHTQRTVIRGDCQRSVGVLTERQFKMITKYHIAKGAREYMGRLPKGLAHCVSGSGVFTVEVLHKGEPVYALILREDYVMLPPFQDECQIRLVGRDTMEFTIFVSDERLS